MNNRTNIIEARHKRTLWLVETAMLAAIVILLSITPLGYLKTPLLEITFMMIPVVIASVAVGPLSGAIVGGVFGITSFLQCFGIGGYSLFGATLLAINPFFTFLMCIPTRILAGWLPGFVAKALANVDKKRAVASFASALSGALFNTLFFVSTFVITFGGQWQTVVANFETNYAASQGIESVSFGISSLYNFIIFIVGTNGIIEAIVTAVVGGAIAMGLHNAIKHRFK